jgi:uridine kinase
MNIDVPEALMIDRLIDCIKSVKNSNSVRVPAMGWTENFNVEITQNDLKQRPIFIVEGFLLFVDHELADLFDSRIFIDVSDLNILYRRLSREKGIQNMPYIYDIVIPMSRQYRNMQIETQQKGNSDVIFDGNQRKEDILHMVVEYINEDVLNNVNHIQINTPPWKVSLGDLLTDHEWHPLDYDNLKGWLKKPETLNTLDVGKEIAGKTFTYRRSKNTPDEYEIQLNEGCNMFRYTEEPTSGLGYV